MSANRSGVPSQGWTVVREFTGHAISGALVTILEELPTDRRAESALLSETALAEDWDRPEEDEAWKHLQEVQ